jgi:hypothetical protein
MQTMTSAKGRALTRGLLFICSVATVICALASLVGVPIGLVFVVPLGLMYLLMYVLRLQEWSEDKRKAPGRAGRPGASGG